MVLSYGGMNRVTTHVDAWSGDISDPGSTPGASTSKIARRPKGGDALSSRFTADSLTRP